MIADCLKSGIQFLHRGNSRFLHLIDKPEDTMAIDALVIRQPAQSAISGGKIGPIIRLNQLR